MTNIGIVGAGARAGSFATTLTQTKRFRDRARLAALCDINPKRLAAAKRMYDLDVRTFTDYDAFLRQEGLDAVIVTTPCNTHAVSVAELAE